MPYIYIIYIYISYIYILYIDHISYIVSTYIIYIYIYIHFVIYSVAAKMPPKPPGRVWPPAVALRF